MSMVKQPKLLKKRQPPAPKRAVVRHKDNGTLMAFDEDTGMFYISHTSFTVFPSKTAGSRAVNRMCEEHDPDFWRLHDVYEYEE